MPNARDLGRQSMLADLQAVRELEVKAITGRKRASGVLTLRGDTTNGDKLSTNRIYVRLLDNEQEVLVCYNASGQGWRVNTPVRVTRDAQGDWYVNRIDDRKATELYGDYAPSVAQAPVDSDVTPIKITGLDYKPGSLYNSTASSLKVQIRPFTYRYLDSLKRWPGVTELDLTNYLPSTTSYWGWVWVGINPKDNSITAVAGSEFINKGNLTVDDLLTINISDMIPSDAIRVQEGITALTGDHNIVYARSIVTTVPTQKGTLGTGTIASGNTYPAYGPVTLSGALTIAGTLRLN